MLRTLFSAAMAVGASCSAVAATSHEAWVSTWSTAPQASTATLSQQTIRMIVRTAIGGNKVRIKLSNLYGSRPLAVGAAHIALLQQGSSIVPGTDRALAFGGQPVILIPPGAYALSDPVDLAIPQLSNLAVSVFLPSSISEVTAHNNGLNTTFISPPGDFTSSTSMLQGTTVLSYYFLTAVYVTTNQPADVVVAFGDSITDGALATPNTESSWPSVLGKLLIDNSKHPHVAVLNEGIGGNRLLRGFFAENALARFDRDAVDQPGVSVVILLEGINDIGDPYSPNGGRCDEIVSTADLVQAMQQLIARGHMHNIKMVGATLTPYEGAVCASPEGVVIRKELNEWIRSSGSFDAVVDFDKVIEDPAQRGHFLAAYDSGDHLHPNDSGYKAMAVAAAEVLEHMSR